MILFVFLFVCSTFAERIDVPTKASPIQSLYNPYYKQAGLFGGLAAGSTIVYYQVMTDIIEPYASKYQYPELVIYSANWKQLKDWVYMNPPRWDLVIDEMVYKFNQMNATGAEFGAILCNTLHYVFDDIQARVSMPLISIVTSVLNAMEKTGYKKTILFGTKSTVTDGYYQKAFEGHIDMIVPDPADVAYIDNKIFTELMHGIFTNTTRQAFIDIIEKNQEAYGIDSVVLGCTEISLLLTEPEYSGVHVCDSTHLHATALAEYSKNFSE